MSEYSMLLFAKPSFWEGFGSVLDFGNTLHDYNFSETPQEADARAIHSDWCAVGLDLREALTEVAAEHE